MQFHQDFSHGSDLSEKSSLKRPFTKKWSSKDPESYPWWRKVSAIKTEQSSAVKIKKTPFSTLKNGGKSVQNQVNFDGFRPKCTLLSDERMHEKTPFSSMEVGNKCSKPKNPGLKKGDDHERARVLETLKMFRAKCKEISQKSGVDVRRIDFTAKYELTKQGKLCCTSCKSMGNVPGIIVGDRFKYRVELTIVGLHSRSQHGIDYMMYHGQILATCVVAKEGYSDKMTDSEVITYTGEGGIVKTNQGDIYEDQKLIRGNRALMNSMKVKNDVRVVRGFGRTTYIYDGLYKVVGFEEKRGFFNNLIFEFKLKRCPGQPSICWYKLKNA